MDKDVPNDVKYTYYFSYSEYTMFLDQDIRE